jgi:hypothetical protein
MQKKEVFYGSRNHQTPPFYVERRYKGKKIFKGKNIDDNEVHDIVER